MREATERAASVAACLPHDFRHGARVRVAHRFKPGDDPGPVSSVAVLARLPFSSYVEDLDLEANNCPALHGDEIGGRVANRPRLFAARFERPGLFLDLLAEPGVVHHL